MTYAFSRVRLGLVTVTAALAGFSLLTGCDDGSSGNSPTLKVPSRPVSTTIAPRVATTPKQAPPTVAPRTTQPKAPVTPPTTKIKSKCAYRGDPICKPNEDPYGDPAYRGCAFPGDLVCELGPGKLPKVPPPNLTPWS
jgi:hypothetical protein